MAAPDGSVEVLGGGFGRTGTHTLMTALNMLGYQTHHMSEVVAKQQAGLWLQAARDKRAGRPIDWQPILDDHGYTAAVDWPEVHFFKELLAAYPRAKVVLTMRDFEAWYTSVRDTIWQSGSIGMSVAFPPHTAPLLALFPWLRGFKEHYQMIREVVWDGTFDGRFTNPEDKEFVRQVYEAHVAEVRRVVPPERLLLFRPQDGWGPLCAFLGKPAPQQPFPHTNDTEMFKTVYIARVQDRSRRARRIIRIYNSVLAAVAAAGVAVVARVVRSRAGRQ